MNLNESDQFPETGEQREQSHLFWFLPLLCVVILGAAGIFFFFLFDKAQTPELPVEPEPFKGDIVYPLDSDGNPTPELLAEVEPFENFRGSVYLTLALVEGDRGGGNKADTNEYIFDIGENTLREAVPGDDSVKMTSGVSPDGTRLAYMSSPYDANAPDDYFFPVTEISQLYIHNMDTGAITKLTDQGTFGKRKPEWSPDGERIVYYSFEIENGFTPPNPDLWEIDVIDLEGNRETIASGVGPSWSPDGGSILYVKEDGLYVYDMQTRVSEFVYELDDEPLTTLMKYELSDDGTKFAWTNPLKNTITIYDVVSWEPFEMRPNSVIEVTGYAATYWPTFSPDNRYLIVQWGGYSPETNVSRNFRMGAYDLLTGDKKILMDFEPYRFDASWISDWVY